MSVNVSLLDGKGYVYEEEDARRLRLERRIVGALVGSLKNVRGESTEAACLPMVLGPEEIALCLKRGWIVLTRPLCIEDRGDRPASEAASDAIGGRPPESVVLPSRRRAEQISAWPQQPPFLHLLRCAVFEDLHSRGFFLTGGAKFGGDWLAYPGDPLLYHAQFVVRVVRSTEIAPPLFFVSASRGAHAARKHLLVAFGDQERPGGQIDIRYITVAPHDGFGQSGGSSNG